MSRIYLSKRAKDFIDAADDSGNIRNDRKGLLYVNAIDNACKVAGITTGAVYLFAGKDTGDLSISHKFNFLDLIDSDSAFRMTFPNGVTYNNLGVKFSTSQYGDTKLVPYTDLEDSNISLSFYRTVASQNSGGDDLRSGFGNNILLRGQRTTLPGGINTQINYVGHDNVGFILSSKTATEFFAICKNIVNTTALSNPQVTRLLYSFYLGACNDGQNHTVLNFTGAGYGFCHISTGMSSQQAIAFSHLITAAQRAYRGV